MNYSGLLSTCLFLIASVRSEIFQSSDVKESDLTSSDRSDSSDGQGDPFLVEPNQKSLDSGSGLADTDNSSSEAGNDKMNLVESMKNINLVDSALDMSSNLKNKKKNEPFWAEVMIDNKKKDVLVNVRKVTIIESIVPDDSKADFKDGKTEVSPKVQRRGVPTPSPYIKVQMPTSYPVKSKESDKGYSKESTSKGIFKKDTEKEGSSKEDDKKESTSKGIFKKDTEKEEEKENEKEKKEKEKSKKHHKKRKHSKKSKKKDDKASKKSVETTTVSKSKDSESSKKTKEVEATTSKSKNTETGKKSKFGYSKGGRSKSEEKTATASATRSDPFSGTSSKPSRAPIPTAKSSKEEYGKETSAGTIFDVLKNMPSGGKESDSIFVEGTFKFPKKKEISSKVFKLSGYISG